MMRKQIVFAAALAAALAGQGRAQKPAAPLPAFTVTSVRPYVSPGYAPHAPRYDPMRLYVEGMSPMELIQEAYGVSTNQIVGLPDWAWWSKTKFTVVGTTDTPATPDQMKLMLRRLLQDRFQLQFDDVTAVQSVYELVISPAGLKVRALNDGESCSAANQARIAQETAKLKNFSPVSYCTTAELVQHLNMMQSLQQLDLPVVDRTGLTGSYLLGTWREMDLEPQPDGGAKISYMETMQDVIAKELGLTLVKASAPFRVLKVTHIAPPTAD